MLSTNSNTSTSIQNISSSNNTTENQAQSTEEIVSENYSINTENYDLFGVITAPKDYKNKKLPTIVISHGFNNTLEMYAEYAETFAKMGYLVYRFDFYGGSTRSKSGGTDMLNMSVLTEKSDLKSVIDVLSKENYIDTENIILMGVSQGGVVSTLYAAEYLENVSKLILIFPAYVLFDDVKQTYQNLNVASQNDIPNIITHRNATLGAIYLKDALAINIDAEIQKVNAPVLIVHGTNDNIVPYTYATKANNLFSKSTLVTVQNGGHWIDSDFNKVALPAIQTFINSAKKE